MFAYDDVVAERYPTIRAGVINAIGLANGPSPPELLDEYRAEQRAACERLDATAIADLPSIAAWRRAFARFGARPTQHRNAAEALLRRLAKHGAYPPSTPSSTSATSSRSRASWKSTGGTSSAGPWTSTCSSPSRAASRPREWGVGDRRESGGEKDDADRATSFYRDVFGWNINSMPEMQYHLVSTGPTSDQGMPSEPGFIGGGMSERQEPVRNPVITIDVDKALATIGEHGGSTVTGRTPVGEMGFSAYFTDSEGNLMGLWQTASG